MTDTPTPAQEPTQEYVDPDAAGTSVTPTTNPTAELDSDSPALTSDG